MNDPNTDGRSLTSRALWLMLARTVPFALNFALPLLIVRQLNQTDFGVYKQVFLVVSNALGILPLSFDYSAYYFLPRAPEKRGAVVFNVLLVHLTVGGLALAALLLYPGLLTALMGSEELSAHAALIGLVILSWLPASFLEIVALANGDAKRAGTFIVLGQSAKALLLLTAAGAFGSVRALIVGALIYGVGQTIVLLAYLHAQFPGFSRAFDRRVFQRQLAYALPVGIGILLWIVLNNMHSYIVSHQCGTTVFAIYAVGCFSVPLVDIISTSVGTLLIPHISALQKQGATDDIIRVTAAAMRKLAALYFPIYALLLVVSHELILVLFREAYLESLPIFVVYITLIPVGILMVDPIIRSHAEHRFFAMKVRPALIAVSFVALWYGTQRWGMMGSVVILVATSLLDRLIEAAKAFSIIGVTWRDISRLKDVGKIAVATLGAALSAAMLRAGLADTKPIIVLGACGVLFAAVYPALLWLLGVLSTTEREMIGRYLSRLKAAAFSRHQAKLPGPQVDARHAGHALAMGAIEAPNSTPTK